MIAEIYCDYSKKLLDKLLLLNDRTMNKIDLGEVIKAIFYAKQYHGNQMRQSGEPYYSHPLEVAYMISDYLFRTDIIVSSILHDTIEDTNLTKEMIANIFGTIVANQVEDLTRVKDSKKISSIEMIELLYKQKKYDLLMIKLFDRLHNMQTIEAQSYKKLHKTTLETMKIFLTLSAHLGMLRIEKQLSELCLQAW